MHTSNRKPVVSAAFGRGLHDHLDRSSVERFSLRWNHDCFVGTAATDVRDLFTAPEPRLAA